MTASLAALAQSAVLVTVSPRVMASTLLTLKSALAVALAPELALLAHLLRNNYPTYRERSCSM